MNYSLKLKLYPDARRQALCNMLYTLEIRGGGNVWQPTTQS